MEAGMGRGGELRRMEARVGRNGRSQRQEIEGRLWKCATGIHEGRECRELPCARLRAPCVRPAWRLALPLARWRLAGDDRSSVSSLDECRVGALDRSLPNG